MSSEMVPNGTDGAKEPSTNSTRRLNSIAADQVGAMYLMNDAELEKNFEFVHDDRSSSCPQENSSGIQAPSTTMYKENGHSCFFDQETNKPRSGHTKPPRLYVRMRYSQQRFLGGEYPHKGWVTLLRWSQDIGVQTAQFNIKKVSTTRSDKLVDLELHYKTKSSMCNALSFQDLADQIPIFNPREKNREEKDGAVHKRHRRLRRRRRRAKRHRRRQLHRHCHHCPPPIRCPAADADERYRRQTSQLLA